MSQPAPGEPREPREQGGEMSQPDPGEPREPREQGGEMSQPSPGEPGEPRERGVRCAERGGQVSGAAWASSSCLTTWAPRRAAEV